MSTLRERSEEGPPYFRAGFPERGPEKDMNSAAARDEHWREDLIQPPPTGAPECTRGIFCLPCYMVIRVYACLAFLFGLLFTSFIQSSAFHPYFSLLAFERPPGGEFYR